MTRISFNFTIPILVFTLFVLSHCTEKKPKPKTVLDLEKSYQSTQEELSKFDAKIKAAAGDEGLIIQYNYDKELTKSRLERLKEQLKAVSPESLQDTTAAAAGGGHH